MYFYLHLYLLVFVFALRYIGSSSALILCVTPNGTLILRCNLKRILLVFVFRLRFIFVFVIVFVFEFVSSFVFVFVFAWCYLGLNRIIGCNLAPNICAIAWKASRFRCNLIKFKLNHPKREGCPWWGDSQIRQDIFDIGMDFLDKVASDSLVIFGSSYRLLHEIRCNSKIRLRTIGQSYESSDISSGLL